MEKFTERLKELREDAGLNIAELAKETGFSSIAVSRWERELRIPNYKVIITLAEYFGVTTDYLLGLED